ncbi:MAG: hypothetical protein ACK5LT_01075 [Lachnospirales bacterium]
MVRITLFEILAESYRLVHEGEDINDFLIAFTGFCYSLVSCDNHVNEFERKEIEDFAHHVILSDKIDNETRSYMFTVANYNTTFNDIIPFLDKLTYRNLCGFNFIYKFLSSLDGKISPEEELFSEKWMEYLKSKDDGDVAGVKYIETLVTFIYCVYSSAVPSYTYVPDITEEELTENIKTFNDTKIKNVAKAVKMLVENEVTDLENPILKKWKAYYDERMSD